MQINIVQGTFFRVLRGLANCCACVRGFRAAKVIAIETFIDKRLLMIDLSSILSRLQPPWSSSHPESRAAWQQRWKLTTRMCMRVAMSGYLRGKVSHLNPIYTFSCWHQH